MIIRIFLQMFFVVFVLLLLVVKIGGVHVQKAEQVAETRSLEYVQVIWRHGDRSPSNLLNPNDIIKWPDGTGELTEEGVRQQYRLGQWLRKRYDSFVGDFDRKAIYIRSSDYNRTLMSAMANMAGLFPPKTQLAENLNWQPVPVHTMPKFEDKQLYEDIRCPKAAEELAKQWKTEKAREILKENQNLLDFMARNINRSRIELDEVWMVHDNFFCEKSNNISWPEWLNSSTFEKLETLYYETSRLEYHTEVLRRLRGGTLLEEIFERFTNKSQGKLGNEARFYAYSAHDATIAALLSTFGIYYEIFPKYATVLMIEMHRNSTQRYLRVFHKNETDVDEIFEYFIPGCDMPCTLEKLKSDLSKYFPDDWEEECGLKEKEGIVAYIASILFLTVTTTIFATLYVFEKTKSRKSKLRILNIGPNRDDHMPMLYQSDEEEI